MPNSPPAAQSDPVSESSPSVQRIFTIQRSHDATQRFETRRSRSRDAKIEVFISPRETELFFPTEPLQALEKGDEMTDDDFFLQQILAYRSNIHTRGPESIQKKQLRKIIKEIGGLTADISELFD